MEKNVSKWKKVRKTGATLLLTISILLSGVSEVFAEGNQPSSDTHANVQLIAEETKAANIVRYEGRSRDNVAENVAKAHFSDSKKVILVNREKFPDAISATNISQGRYPVLYTHSDHVTKGTIELLQSMPLDEIYILGGTLSIDDSVVSQLEKETDAKITRVAGRSRYDANVNAIKEHFNQKDHVVIASGEVYSDALYGVSYANTIDAPVVLTKTSQLESSTIELLRDLGVKQATIIGGSLTVTDGVEEQLNQMKISYERIAGRNRYIGSAQVASESYSNPGNIVIASGEVFSDALVSAPLAQKLDAPILLVRKTSMEDAVEKYLINNNVDLENVYIQGGSLTINQTIEELIKTLSTYSVKTDEDIDDVELTYETVTGSIAFKTIRRDNKDLEKGVERVVQEGKNGTYSQVFKIIYVNGKLQGEPILVSEKVVTEPVDKIIEVGTKVAPIVEEDKEIDFSKVDTALFNQEMLKYVNQERALHGREPLTYSSDLQRGTDARAEDLVTIQGLDVNGVGHLRPDGSSWRGAFTYLDEDDSYNRAFEVQYSLGENIAQNVIDMETIETVEAGERTLEDALAERLFYQYKRSPGHHSNMIRVDYNEMATATRMLDLGWSYEVYNVQIFDSNLSNWELMEF